METKITYEANGWSKYSELDIFNEGCQPDKCHSDWGCSIFKGNTLEGCIKECQFFSGEDRDEYLIYDSCDELGRLDIQVYENEEGIKASEIEIELWKNNQQALYLSTYTFYIKKVTRESISLIQADTE